MTSSGLIDIGVSLIAAKLTSVPRRESVAASTLVAGPLTPSSARRSSAWPTAALMLSETSGESTTTTSPPNPLSSATSSGRRTMLTVFRPRVFAKAITHRPTPELAAFCTTHSPGFRSTYSLSSSAAVGGFRVCVRGQGGKAACRYDHPLPPSEAAQRRQDPVADLDALHPRPYRENPADAFIADDGGERGADCVDALRDQEVVWVDGGKFDADENLVEAGSIGFGNVDILQAVDRVAKSCKLNGAHVDTSCASIGARQQGASTKDDWFEIK